MPRIMENGNESLQTMGLNTNFYDVDYYTNTEVKDDKPRLQIELRSPPLRRRHIHWLMKNVRTSFQKSRLYPSRTIGVFAKMRNSVPRRVR